MLRTWPVVSPAPATPSSCSVTRTRGRSAQSGRWTERGSRPLRGAGQEAGAPACSSRPLETDSKAAVSEIISTGETALTLTFAFSLLIKN